MTGAGGADTFVFVFGDSSAASGQHDRITDFASAVDRIDLSGIDAIAATGSYDQFRFIGASAFDGIAGELDYVFNSSLGVTVLQGDTRVVIEKNHAVRQRPVGLDGNFGA